MKKVLLSLFVQLMFVSAFAQNLSLTELFSICNKPNWDEVNEFILKKGWEYYESSKGDDTHYNTITWSYQKEYYNDKAKGWFYLYTYEGYPNKIVYTFFNKASYNTIKSGISSSGMKLIDNSIEDNEIVTQYSGSNFIVTVRTSKREKEDSYYSDNTITAYSVTLIKKAGVYDNDNGLKKVYDSFGNVESEFTLKDGKINGIAKGYYSSGQVKVISNFINGTKQGKSTEYDLYGNITAEYNYINGEPSGIYKIYEDGKIQIVGSVLNGQKSGPFKEFNDLGLVDKEYNYKAGVLEGAYIENIYEEGKLVLKIKGSFANGMKNGLWQTYKINEKGAELIEYSTYSEDVKTGSFKEISNDSIIIGTYKDGNLDGSYKVYRSLSTMILGRINGDTTNCPLVAIGSYNEGYKNGYWKYYSLSKTLVKEGRFNNDRESGEWKYYFEKYVDDKNTPLPYSGKLFLVENYENGAKNGKEVRYGYLERKPVPCDTTGNSYNNPMDTCHRLVWEKVLETSYYKNDQLHGPCEIKDSNGITTFKGNFVFGKKDGVWLESEPQIGDDNKGYYIFSRGSYVNGLASGYWETFIKEDFIFSKSNYVNGKLNGKSITYNSFGKPKEEKYFLDGKFKSMFVYDSLGVSKIRGYEILSETYWDMKCRKTEFYENGKILQDYMLRKKDGELCHHSYFDMMFLLLTGKYSDGLRGYPDGEFKVFDINDRILEEGSVYRKNKIGKWKRYFYDSNIYIEQEYIDSKGGVEHFYLIDSNLPFTGKFIQKYSNGKDKFEIKISEGLRNGKSKYFDESGKLTDTEKYEKGVLEK